MRKSKKNAKLPFLLIVINVALISMYLVNQNSLERQTISVVQTQANDNYIEELENQLSSLEQEELITINDYEWEFTEKEKSYAINEKRVYISTSGDVTKNITDAINELLRLEENENE